MINSENIDEIRKLLLNSEYSQILSAAHYLLDIGNVEIFQDFLNALLSQSLDKQKIIYDFLYSSSQNNNNKIFQMLFNEYCNPDIDLQKILDYSCINNNLEIFQMLLNKNINFYDEQYIANIIGHKRHSFLNVLLKDSRCNIYLIIDYSLDFNENISDKIKEYLSKKNLLYFNEEIEYLIWY